MKKVLAIVLAIVMTLSMTVAAFAAVEVAPGQIFLGPDDNVTADPGETVSIPVRFAGNPLESDAYPTDGYAVFYVLAATDVNYGSMTAITIDPDAAAAGVVLYENENSAFNTAFQDEDGAMAFITLAVPASLISADMTVFTVDIKVADDWEVIDNVATNPVPFEIMELSTPGFISEEDAALVGSGELLVEEVGFVADIYSAVYNSCNVLAKPYEPSFTESLTEQLKGLASAILDILVVGINFLKGELTPADWYEPGVHDVVDLSFITDALGSLVGSLL